MRFIALLFMICPFIAYANNDVLTDGLLDTSNEYFSALQQTYVSCIGIDEELADLKKMAGINTAVTAVGTAAGVGATVTGFVKQSKDNRAAEIEEEIKKLEELLKDVEPSTQEEIDAFLAEFDAEMARIKSDVESGKKVELESLQSELDQVNKQSKKLGNWRTGLLAGSTATNVAGAIISGKNKVDDDLQTQIDACIASIDTLKRAMMQARIDGMDISEAENIVRECEEFKYVDVSKINNRAQGAFISSLAGTATGLAGTVTSAMANSDGTRNDNTESGKSKEKNLNTAANVLSIGTTLASGTATVFNATQISAIKKVATVAEKCTEVLK